MGSVKEVVASVIRGFMETIVSMVCLCPALLALICCDVGCLGFVENHVGKSPRGFPCSGHGECRYDELGYYCQCQHGYSGATCLKEYTSMAGCPFDCSGNGDCKQGVCYCHVGFGGSDCSADLNTAPQSVFKERDKLIAIILLYGLGSGFCAMMAMNFINGKQGLEMIPLFGTPTPQYGTETAATKA